jgi:hypothetical protein
MFHNTNYKLYYVRSIITCQTIHNNTPDIIILDKTIKGAYSVDIPIPIHHILHCTITEKLQKYTYRHKTRSNKITVTENGLYNTTSTIHNVHYSKQITPNFTAA